MVWQWAGEGKLKLREGVQEALDEFKSRGLHPVITLSNCKRVTEHATTKMGIKPCFDSYLLYNDAEKLELAFKPAEGIYELAARKLKLNRQELIISEDSLTGIATGKDAGTQGIMILDLESSSLKDKRNTSLACINFLNSLERIAQNFVYKQ